MYAYNISLVIWKYPENYSSQTQIISLARRQWHIEITNGIINNSRMVMLHGNISSAHAIFIRLSPQWQNFEIPLKICVSVDIASSRPHAPKMSYHLLLHARHVRRRDHLSFAWPEACYIDNALTQGREGDYIDVNVYTRAHPPLEKP